MYDGDYYWKLDRYKIQRAAKAHRCDECGRAINKGERYEYFTGLSADSGYWYTTRTCPHCLGARHWLQVECNGWLFEAVYEDLKEHFEEQPDLHLGRLLVGMRRRWARRDGTLMDVTQGDPSTWESKRQPALMR